ncbi:MAG: tRNA dihydrouridine(20/20a) synthase DusA [Proteobacteria bacterium]|nr:tRNA dihydrouridine(20/20a) synthase DusA [Pseudomonadota bacterium]
MHLFSVAPMMKKTDKHFRFLCRNLSKNSLLYTEMIHSNAILRGNVKRLLDYTQNQNPLVLQLGGSDPNDLADAVEIASDFNYNEINLNVGCPSKKVKSGNFGVFLMKDINLLSKCVEAMQKKISVPLTIKCRIGVDDYEGYKFLHNFVSALKNCGVNTFIIHARKAISGLDTKRNRSIPPLQYDAVYKIKNAFPDLRIIINGGIESMNQIKNHLNYVDGVMLGRKIYADPLFLCDVDKNLFNESTASPIEALNVYMKYILNLEHKGDVNRAINHLMVMLKSLSIQKNQRNKLLGSLKDTNSNMVDLFKDFKVNLHQKNPIPNL